MNLEKFVYVSPQQHYKIHDEWYYDYIINGKRHSSSRFKYRQGSDTFRDIEWMARREGKNVRKLSIFAWNRLLQKVYENRNAEVV